MTDWLRALAIIGLTIMGTWETHAQISYSDTTKWYNRTYNLDEVTITKKRTRYSRKNNPAVDFMRKVIEAKRLTDIKSREYCSYEKYQKLTFAVNELTPDDLDKGFIGIIPGAINQVEPCEYNNKLILPLTVSEVVSKYLHCKSPHKEKTIIIGERSKGIGQLLETGDILTEAIKDFFTDINIYDNQIRLLHQSFTSPIADDAIAFYRYFIVDTLEIGTDRCVHLAFSPNNPRDFGFSGEIYVMDDGSYQVRRCVLAIPKKSGVNFVDGIKTLQEFTTLSDGSRVLTTDDMIVELSLFDFIDKAIVMRNTRLSDYSFEQIPDEDFTTKHKVELESKAKDRDDYFWLTSRRVRLTQGESNMDSFIDGIDKSKGLIRYVLIGLKLLIENYIETGSVNNPSKVDIGPITSMVTNNFIDGWRFRLGGQTTANLSPHLFLKGYYAHGLDSKKNYYDAQLTYSFNIKDYQPQEYPMRNVTIATSYDVCAPTDKFLMLDKDNVFTSLKWTTVDKMMFYRRHLLRFEREDYIGLRTTIQFKIEDNEACGALSFINLANNASEDVSSEHLKTSELKVEIRYAPNEKTITTKQRRHKLNHEVPVITLSHTMGFKGAFGGDYKYNFTELSLYKRFWMKSWGRLDVNLKGGIEWNKVPFPLLIMPAANLSYISQPETFSLIGQMEFLNDRYASLDIAWDINGKIFNRIPLLKKLKWREYVGVRSLWGYLSEKNDPSLARNQGSSILMLFPDGSNVMDSGKPYFEMSVGISNIFRFFQVEYVRRLNYNGLSSAHRHGVRVMMKFRF